MDKNALASYRCVEVRRPQYPCIVEWIDREFQVIYKNLCASPEANISCLLEDDEEEGSDDVSE